MDFYALSDKAITTLLGQRLKALRLRKNITQAALAKSSTLSINTIKSLEKGQGKLTALIAILRELNALSQLNDFIADAPISPIQMATEYGLLKNEKSHRKFRLINASARLRASRHTTPIKHKLSKSVISKLKRHNKK